MADNPVIITYDDVACEYTVSVPALGKSATAATLQDALAWLCKIISDPGG